MQALNAAYEEAVLRLSLRGTDVQSAPAEPAAAAAPSAGSRRFERRPVRGVQHDAPSFTIDVLPVEAFEALLCEAGFTAVRRWTDARGWFAVFLAAV